MIVNCENCNARYKLDDAKVSSKGAKITCPRCRHVFVVQKQESAGEARALEPAASTMVHTASSLAALAMPAATPVAPVAPATRPATGLPGRPSAPKRDVHSLDFRKVGIASWRVKVKIGLIYDFSDYKTLRKYIQDGRVTPADLLSHDGRNWVAIGELPDLEKHFVDVYEDAEKAKALEEATAPALAAAAQFDDGPTSIVGMNDLASSLAGQMAAGGGGVFTLTPEAGGPSRPTPPATTGRGPPTLPPRGGNTVPPRARGLTPSPLDSLDGGAEDSFEIAKARQRERLEARKAASRSDTGEKPSAPWVRIALAVGVLALAGVGVWFLQQRSGASAPAQPPVAATPAAADAPAAGGPDDVRQRIREELQKELEKSPAADPIEVRDDRQLIPIKPTGEPGREATRSASTARSSTPPPSTESASPTGTMTTAPATARDHADAGDDAWRRGAWSEAVAAYREAVRLDGSSATLQMKLGRSLYKNGDTTGANTHLTTAQRGAVPEASKWLGHIARDQGDVAGAIGHYNIYLKGSPSDAAEIQREIDALTGG